MTDRQTPEAEARAIEVPEAAGAGALWKALPPPNCPSAPGRARWKLCGT
jgi:hypothetical protein